MTDLHLVLLLSVLMFSAGLYLVVSRDQALIALVGVELMLNAANLNFIAFAAGSAKPMSGWVMVIAVLVVAAIEAALGLALIMHLQKAYGTTNLKYVRRIREERS